ncbi:glycoside hydrolase family 32 protein [Paenibacillus sp. MMS20-IR301]|uniref:glycoside hydrolase family 32 protein n=1 Tax=Paenibacillus sp. MMS20-IR301 TaxID=2895946 RepID=UPI0028EF581E|nr:glycoside hydrolase family 32 protein [Paenibacillus sp. MMS20-IR301]WNS43970.1 glycoside hydrolase family 32 protein [Paenibacillus sp. MMS20-IR301]
MSATTKQNYRGVYHFSPEKNWMNDPNGLVYFEGEYHLFFQHHPDGMTMGEMHWGHAVSKDLVTWEELPLALVPDELGMIFSGSAVVDWHNTTGFFGEKPGLVAIFTHHLNRPEDEHPLQYQSIAYSKDNGRTWTKYAGNPVLTHDTFIDFRDPKVFWDRERSRWVMIVACGQTVCLYHSPDLIHWTFASEFGTGTGSHDGVWECPDLFPLAVDGDKEKIRWVMLVSIGADPAYEEGSRTQYFTGGFDGEVFTPDEASHSIRWVDYGRDNYAGVSWSDLPEEDGRRLFIGWMSNWMYAPQTPSAGFRGAMTIPRELTLETRNGEAALIQRPAQELEAVRIPVLSLTNASAQEINAACAGIQLEAYVIEAELAPGMTAGFRMKAGAAEQTLAGINGQTQELYVDRRVSGKSSFHPLFAGMHSARLAAPAAACDLHIYVDRSSVEVFAGGGQAVITDLIFPEHGSTGLAAFAEQEEKRFLSVRIYELSPAAPAGGSR